MGKRFFRNFFRKNENEGEEVSMNHFKQRSVQSEESFFSNNEKEVTQMICRIMSYAFCIYPVMLLLNVIKTPISLMYQSETVYSMVTLLMLLTVLQSWLSLQSV